MERARKRLDRAGKAVVVSLTVIVCLLVMIRLLSSSNRIPRNEVRYNIYSTQQQEGDPEIPFSFGYREVKGKLYYLFYVEQEDGSVKLKQYASKHVDVYPVLENDETPYLLIEVSGLGLLGYNSYKVYVPKNSILATEDFNLGISN